MLPRIATVQAGTAGRPNVLLVMSDDQGWGDVGYAPDAVVKTPVLDEMAATCLRLDRFYAAAPVCSPTRASCLTGRHPDRCGVFDYGYAMPLEELTIAEVLKANGYATGHFGKWHLGGVALDNNPEKAKKLNRGHLVSPLPTHPGNQGFEEWFAAANAFDIDPVVFQRNGEPVGKVEGEGSEVVVRTALDWLKPVVREGRSFFATVWFGSPHTPHKASPADRAPYADKRADKQRYLGEITAMDRAIGTLREGLRELGVADNTLLWFCSDNGPIRKGSNGGLRGFKGGLWEGGVRVPALIEWPARISEPMQTSVLASTLDMFPTIVDVLGIDVANPVLPLDGISLVPLLDGQMAERPSPIPFELRSNPTTVTWAALTGNRFKLHVSAYPGEMKNAGGTPKTSPQLYDLLDDPDEKTNVAGDNPEVVADMTRQLEDWQASVTRSLAGADYAQD